jgi:cytochrome b pre-mRNA-processing protein 3
MPMAEENQGQSKTPGAWQWLKAMFRPEPGPAHRLYVALVGQARLALFYRALGVPDTPEGRFELVALHAALLTRRLAAAGEAGRATAQSLFDLMFADLDGNLRELGVGDLSVGKEIKRLATQFYARLQALDQANAGDDWPSLAPMLATNVYNGASPPSPGQATGLINVLRETNDAIQSHELNMLLTGDLRLPEERSLLELLPAPTQPHG